MYRMMNHSRLPFSLPLTRKTSQPVRWRNIGTAVWAGVEGAPVTCTKKRSSVGREPTGERGGDNTTGTCGVACRELTLPPHRESARFLLPIASTYRNFYAKIDMS